MDPRPPVDGRPHTPGVANSGQAPAAGVAGARAAGARAAGPAAGQRSRGQVAVIFVMAVVAFVGLCAVAVDISWYWANTLRMQRAADAAALAGVVHLPGAVTLAVSDAQAEAAKNGYTPGIGGVTMSATQDPTNPRRLRVTLSAPVGTFFARVFGIANFPASRSSKAEYVLPVPMGSPDAWYGVFGKLRHPGGGLTTTNTTSGVTSYSLPTANSPSSPSNWTNPVNAQSYNDGTVTTKAVTTNPYQMWQNFGIALPGSGTIAIDGIEVEVRMSSTDPTNCQLDTALSWNGATLTAGTGWTSAQSLFPTSTSFVTYAAGGPATTWGRTWSAGDFTNANFEVRLQYVDPGGSCTDGYTLAVDHVRVRVYYRQTTSTFVPDSNITGPAGQTLTPQGFWGVMLSSGATDINGDKYMPRNNGGSGSNPDYDYSTYYNYAVEVPAGSSGNVYVYDPVMCAVQSDMGTGDRWFGGSTPVWSVFELYDTRNTLYDPNDDGAPVATSGALFEPANGLTDPSMGGPNVSGSLRDCTTPAGSTGTNAAGAYHNAWYDLGAVSGGAGGLIYRVHTTTTDPSNPNGNTSANGQNSFGLYSNAAGARIYGLGAMEQYSPLPGGGASTFYLAQIEAVHAGKTMEIRLWDIGDTNGLPASLQILQPTSAGWSAASLQWTAASGTPNSANCTGTGGSGTSITATSSGGTQYFQGCWLTIDIPLPPTYSAPQSGWWKIQYDVGGSSSSAAFDLTTWQVEIKGNPVHLILP